MCGLKAEGGGQSKSEGPQTSDVANRYNAGAFPVPALKAQTQKLLSLSDPKQQEAFNSKAVIQLEAAEP